MDRVGVLEWVEFKFELLWLMVCAIYCVVLNLESGSSSGHLGHIAGTITWGFPGF